VQTPFLHKFVNNLTWFLTFYYCYDYWRWWSEETTAVVTGANKGIGFAVVKRLLELGLTVVLTARNAENGSQAAESLRRIGFGNVHFCCLDISDPSSIAAFASWFGRNLGILDILVITN